MLMVRDDITRIMYRNTYCTIFATVEIIFVNIRISRIYRKNLLRILKKKKHRVNIFLQSIDIYFVS